MDLYERVVRLDPGTTKSGEGREFSFANYPQLGELLDAQRRATDAVERKTETVVRWVFHRGGRPIKSFRGAWATACKRAGVPGAWFHDLRRTGVRNMERAGVPRSVAMGLSGHKTESIYRRYAIGDRVMQDEGVAKLAAYHASKELSQRKTVPFKKAVAK